MKAFAVCIYILALACFSSAQTTGERLKQIVSVEDDLMTCMTENDMTMDDWFDKNQLLNERYKESGNEEKRRLNGCTVECILKKQGLMVGSDIKENKVHAKINKQESNNPRIAKTHKMARICMREVKNITQECEKGFSLFVCLAKEIHKASGENE